MSKMLGSGFQQGAQVKLSGLGADIIGNYTMVSDTGDQITTTFDLRNAQPGIRNVIITNPDGSSASIMNGFTIEHGGAPEFVTDILGRSMIRRGGSDVFYVVATNRGNVDANRVNVWISFPNYFQWEVASNQGLVISDTTGTDTILVFPLSFFGISGIKTFGVKLGVPNDPQYTGRDFVVRAGVAQR